MSDDFKWETCIFCKTRFAMSNDIYQIARERAPDLVFYCPNGHGQVYAKGQTEAEKLRQERDRLAQRIAQKDDELREKQAEIDRQRGRVALETRRVSAAKGQITKLKNRAANGVCPCCNRSFSDLQRHMHSKHPNFIAEPDEASHVH